MSSGPGGLGDRLLRAVRNVAAQFGLPAAELKPCVAALLDGNLGAAARHEAAFVIAIELRRIGLDRLQVLRLLERWAQTIGYPMRDVARAADSAFRRKPDGSFLYHAPGLKKRPDSLYDKVLGPFCRDVDCPRNCPPFLRRRRADFRDEGFTRFIGLGWPQYLRSRRFLAAVETYRAIWRREEQIEWTPGEPFHVTHEQLANLSGGSRRSVARHLAVLGDAGLITYEPGSGEKGNRRASVVSRVVPVPRPPIPAIQDRAHRAP